MSDFEVHIKQTQSGDSIRQANDGLKGLKESAGQVGEKTKEVGQSQEALGRKVSASATITQGALKALKGDLTGLVDVGRGVAAGLGGSFATLALKFTAVGAAAMAGWQAGTFIYEKFIADVLKFGPISKKSIEEFNKLDEVTLTKVRDELDKLYEKLEKTIKRIDEASNRDSAEKDAVAERDLAQLEASMEPGPERDRAVAAAKAKNKIDSTNRTVTTDNARIIELERQKQVIENTIKKNFDAPLAAMEYKRNNTIRALIGTDTPEEAEDLKYQAAKIKRINEVRQEYDAMKASYAPEKEKQQEKVADLSEKIASIRSHATVATIHRDTARAEYSGEMKGIDREETKKAKQNEIDAEVKKAKELQDKFEEEKRIKELQLVQIKADAEKARHEADAFKAPKTLDPDEVKHLSKKQKGNRAKILAKDSDLELNAVVKETAVTQFEKAMKEMALNNERMLKAVEKHNDQLRTAIKNIPL
jgi:hypothetical protein